jgi:uncharacterized protein (DUF58 family)
MRRRPRRWPLQVFRLGSLVVPTAIAWHVAFSAPHPSRLTEAVTYALAPLWLLTAAAVAGRSVDALWQRRRDPKSEIGLLDRLDVLTASGSALAWGSAAAIAASVWVGWASLAIVGLMGSSLLHLAVLWAAWMVMGDDPWRRASLSRRLLPESAVEGATITEELRFTDPRIPAGFRLLACGRVGPRWPVSRYAVEDAASGGEILLESDLGPALRGEHDAEPLVVWLQDVLGLCRSPRVRAGEAKLVVLPKPRRVSNADLLLGQGGSDLAPRLATRLPTEGSFRLREYQPGDDARRIHWVRSQAAQQIVVRLPDELPPDQPAVKLVLDTFLPAADIMDCLGPAELLDVLVNVWLGLAESLIAAGVRVTLVAAADVGGKVAPLRRRMSRRATAAALRLGAHVRWQDELAVQRLIEPGGTIVVSYRLQPDPPEHPAARWIVVPRSLWPRADLTPLTPSPGVMPHPMGTADNRWSRRRDEQLRRRQARRDSELFVRLAESTAPPRAGAFLARRTGPSTIALEALS